MLCLLVYFIDVNTENKKWSKTQETESFKYFSYHMCNVCSLKIQTRGNKNHPLNHQSERTKKEETGLDDLFAHKGPAAGVFSEDLFAVGHAVFPTI